MGQRDSSAAVSIRNVPHVPTMTKRRPRVPLCTIPPAFSIAPNTLSSKFNAASVCNSYVQGAYFNYSLYQDNAKKLQSPSVISTGALFRLGYALPSRRAPNHALPSYFFSHGSFISSSRTGQQGPPSLSTMMTASSRRKRSKLTVKGSGGEENIIDTNTAAKQGTPDAGDMGSPQSFPNRGLSRSRNSGRKTGHRDPNFRYAPRDNWLEAQRNSDRDNNPQHRRRGYRRFPRDFGSSAANVLIYGSEDEARKFLHDVRSGRQMFSLNHFNDVLTTLGRQRRLRDALAVLELSEHPDFWNLIAQSKSAKTYTIMIDLYGKAHQLSRAFSLFYGMSRDGVEPNIITYNAMVAACARSNEPDLAYEVFEEMQSNGLNPDKFTYGSLIDSCAKCGQVDRAFEISKMMDTNGVLKDQTIYSALMDACGRAQQLERGFLVFEEMKRDGVWPNLITFSVLIDTCANAREPEKAFYLFSEIKHWGFPKANVIVYTALIDACSKAGWPKRAELVMENMLENEVEPNEITFGALMDGWAKQGDIDRAFGVLKRMVVDHNVLPNAILVGGLIDACRRLKATGRARSLWDLVLEHKIRPARSYYPALMTMAAEQEDFDLAVSVTLHAYARGSMRRVALKSENPSLHALACSLIYLKHRLEMRAEDKGKHYMDRLRVVFNSIAMTPEQMKTVSPEEAFEYCMTWGDIDRPASFRQRGGSIKDRNGVFRRDSSTSAAARRAKEAAAADSAAK